LNIQKPDSFALCRLLKFQHQTYIIEKIFIRLSRIVILKIDQEHKRSLDANRKEQGE